MTVLALAIPGGLDENHPHKVITEVKHRTNRWKVVRPYNSKLERIAWCESRKRWFINTGNGFFGGLQFTLATWWSAGGRGMPHHNSELEQKYRAVKVYKRRGSWADWPICGYR